MLKSPVQVLKPFLWICFVLLAYQPLYAQSVTPTPNPAQDSHIFLPLVDSGVLATPEPPTPSGPTQVCGAVNAPTTWRLAGSPYIVTCDIEIRANQSLTIQPGVIVKFNRSANLLVDGTLRVQGTASQPIHFTSYRDDLVGGDTNDDGSATTPRSGDWGWVQFNEGSDDTSIIEHLNLSYSGTQGCCTYGGAIRLDNASPTIRNITFQNNWVNGIEIPTSQWQTDTWDNTGVVYFVRGDLTIQPDQTLTISKGVIVKFNDSANLMVNGTLRVLGTEEEKVHFTSYRDDLRGGDTNNNGSTTPPSYGDWGWVQFNPSSNDESLVEHLEIAYSGLRNCCTNGGAIRLDNASPTIGNITFENNWINGIEIPSSQWETDTWDNTDVVYFVRGDLTIPANKQLTIVDGMIVKFSSSTNLYVDGALKVLGTTDNPVYFTSIRDDLIGGDTNSNASANSPATGNWGWVQFNPESDDDLSLIEHLEIRYSGLRNCCTNGGAFLLDNASPTIRNITFVNNYINGIEIPSTQWETDTWDNTDIVYFVSGNLTIQQNQSLTISAGMKVKFPGSTSLFVNGTLRVLGTADNLVYFTSIRDDLIGGDTNNNASANSPAKGDWGWVQFNPDSNDADSRLEYLEIRHSGRINCCTNGGAIRLDNAAPTINNIFYFNNYFDGVEVVGTAANLTE